ncbi:unnamed protein product [Gemmata massiliana]|uniref:Uncharacterized protein n=1 Tax=Gemmata massiliana TaxID=1210884 RepID=A0A6P2D0N2_9BACT|nr:hypothetical protein [Gemmata massiliana]VTR93634.1 unnamed protein product [Gemmata massiliana]
MAQLVGTKCVICQEKITNELDSRYCRDCGKPRHTACVRLPDRPTDELCYECGVPVGTLDKPVEPKESPDFLQYGTFPVSRTCPKCRGEKYKRVKPLGWIAFKWDRVCKDCATRYTPPTPWWAALTFVGVGLLLAGFGGISVLLGMLKGDPLRLPAIACEGFLGIIGCLSIYHGLRSLFNPGDV